MRLPAWLRALRPAPAAPAAGAAAQQLGRGLAVAGALWPGPGSPALPDVVVVVDAHGRVARIAPRAEVGPLDVPLHEVAWIGPGLVDSHVHHAFGSVAACLAGGVVATRDLGAPGPTGACCQAGRIVTAPGGYPSRSWGAAGFAVPIAGPDDARTVVAELLRDGVGLIKVALEPAGHAPVPDLATVTALVRAAHEAGLGVTAHALSAAMVDRALEAGVDELAHCPVELLDDALLGRIVEAGVAVVGTLQCLSGERSVLLNAARLVAAGVPLRYGTDLGNGGTRPGADPRELERMAAAGLGREGALSVAVSQVGLGMAPVGGQVAVGLPAALVGLLGDPLEEPAAWARPALVVAHGRVVTGSEPEVGAPSWPPGAASAPELARAPGYAGAPWRRLSRRGAPAAAG